MLIIALKIVGWIFTIIPLVAFVAVSVFIIKGVGEDDSLIMALVLLGLTMLVIGIIILVLVYLSGIFEPSTTFSLIG